MSDQFLQQTGELSQDSKNMAVISWVATIFFGFVPCLLFYVLKADDPYVKDQAKEALNWSITVMIATVAASILAVILIGLLMFPVIFVLNLVFCVMGAIASSKGESFRVPFTLRLLK